MDCAEIRDLLARGERPDGRAVEAHLRSCAACAELLADEGRLGLALGRIATEPAREPQVLAALLDRTARELERERGSIARLRSLASPLRAAIAIAGGGAVAALVVAFARRPDLALYPFVALASSIGALALLAMVAIRVALRPLQRPPLPLAFRAGVLVAAAALPFVIAATPPIEPLHAASLAGAGSDFAARAFGCFAFGGALAFPVLVLLRALDRGGGAMLPTLAAAGGAGLFGVIAIELHCPITYRPHLLVGHATIAAAWILVYGLVSLVATRRP